MSHRTSSRKVSADQSPTPQGKSLRGYTLAHAGRHVRIGPIAFWLSIATVTVMALWSAGTASYFAFRDDLLTRLIARQAEMQYAYEDRITELRAQVDRLTSRQLLDQEQIEQKIDQLVRRQTTLESRASAIAGLPDIATTGATKPSAGPRSAPESITGPESRIPGRSSRLSNGVKVSGIEAKLAQLAQSLDRVETRQSVTLAAIQEGYEIRVRRMRGVMADLGVEVGKTANAAPDGSVGGPFVPLAGRANVGTFEHALHRIQLARGHVDRLNRALLTVPVRKPIAGELDTSSGFGMRLDPFVRAPAMHTGLDFRSPAGEPVHATAAGKVVTAGWNGGYGKLVEIDHGNGFSTRYGHLSEILVSEDQSIRAGQIVGRVGSTGRSTGPHLHYETRIDGDAVDPHKFLRAGLRLGEKS